VSASSIDDHRQRVIADLELTLAEEHSKLLAALRLITELRAALQAQSRELTGLRSRTTAGTIETVGTVAPRTADDVEAILRRRLGD
jgi:hypothetical protein